MSSWQARFLNSSLTTKRTILITGPADSGRSTLLNSLVQLITVDQRIVAIEGGATLPALRERSFTVRITAQPGTPSFADALEKGAAMRPTWILAEHAGRSDGPAFLKTLAAGFSGLATIDSPDPELVLSDWIMNNAEAASFLSKIVPIIVHMDRDPGGRPRALKIFEAGVDRADGQARAHRATRQLTLPAGRGSPGGRGRSLVPLPRAWYDTPPMRRVSLISATALLVVAICMLLPSAALSPGAAASESVTAAAQAHEEAVVRLLILERRVADAETALAQAETRRLRSQKEATDSLERADRAAVDLATARQRYADRVVDAYKTGDFGWLELLFGSDDFSQFISRAVLVGKILAQDEALADQVEQAQASAEEAAAGARTAAAEQAAQVNRLRAVRDDLEAANKEQSALVDSLGDRLAAARTAARAAAQRMAEVNKNVPRVETRPTITTTTPVRTPEPPSSRTGRQLTVKSYAYALRGTTATGISVAPGVIAVDPRVIPLGTRLYVPGYGEGIAADTGGDIKGNTIDVWMSSAQAASDWGIKRITITVYD